MALNRLMHPDNIYKTRQPNFLDLAMKSPSFAKFVSIDVTNRPKLDYSNPEALRQLAMVLLKEDFDLTVDLPVDRLVPTIPLRLNYLLWLGDIFGKKENLRGLDIGAGASCIYPLLGNKLFDWKFLAIESDDVNFDFARNNAAANNKLDCVQVLKVSNEADFESIVQENGRFDFCICNPPFYSSMDEHNKARTSRRPKPQGANTAYLTESVTPGGEIEFVKRIIACSLQLRDRVRVYTTMLGKKSSLSPLRKLLHEAGVPRVGHTEFCQGRTMRWGLAWSFDQLFSFPKSTLEQYHATRATPLKLILSAITTNISTFSIDELQAAIIRLFNELGDISLELVRSASNCRVFIFRATAANWANQRAKRRAAARLAKCADMAANAFALSAASDQLNQPEGDSSNCSNDQSISTLKRPHDVDWIHAEEASGADDDEDADIKKLRCDLENESAEDSVAVGRTPTPPDGKKAILKFYLTLKLLPDKTIAVELNFIAGDNKDMMHQIFQFLKNKLVVSKMQNGTSEPTQVPMSEGPPAVAVMQQ